MVSVRNFIIRARYYLLLLFVLLVVFYVIKSNYESSVLDFDISISNYVQNHLVSNSLTPVIKILTNLGDVICFSVILVLLFIFFKGKGYFTGMTLNLLIVYLVSVIFKNVIMRERPLVSLIVKPSDYSFPSGHTMCSLAFYGFLIYLINKYVNNKIMKWVLISLCILIVVIVAFSRIYLNVHYFTDVICGSILGFICLRMFISYVKIRNIV